MASDISSFFDYAPERAGFVCIMRVEWSLMSAAERLEVDRQRTAAHDAVIDAVNILSRSMAKAGLDNEWRRVLGDDRKDIGDFACFLVAHLGVMGR